MKSSKDLLQGGASALARKSSEPLPNRNGNEAANWVWRKMVEMYGAQWTRERGSAPPTTWSLALGKHDPETIRQAMARVATRHPDWPPSLPQFVACCTPQPEDYGAPSAEAAWSEARAHALEPTSHAWSHDAVRLAGRRIGWGDIHRATGGYAEEVKRAFRQEYARTAEAMATGTPLLEHDSGGSPSQAAQVAGEERARAAAAEYEGISGPQALRLMRTMTGGHDE